MKNVTVTMEEEALEWVRVKAARDNASVSRYLGQFQSLPFPEDTRYLSRGEANERAGLR